jgi:hypothetical protein
VGRHGEERSAGRWWEPGNVLGARRRERFGVAVFARRAWLLGVASQAAAASCIFVGRAIVGLIVIPYRVCLAQERCTAAPWLVSSLGSSARSQQQVSGSGLRCKSFLPRLSMTSIYRILPPLMWRDSTPSRAGVCVAAAAAPVVCAVPHISPAAKAWRPECAGGPTSCLPATSSYCPAPHS